ncbi:MAG: hypothetical protein Q9Q40_04770 [Acidobacteriota bacterium]|nr:hypothetical protein [Acidobacteriota bacterium]
MSVAVRDADGGLSPDMTTLDFDLRFVICLILLLPTPGFGASFGPALAAAAPVCACR